MGTGAYLFSRCAEEVGFDTSRIVYADTPSVEDIFEQIVGVCGGNTLVVGMGNIGGQGLALVRFFRNRSYAAAMEEERRRGPLPTLEKSAPGQAAPAAAEKTGPSAPAPTNAPDVKNAPTDATNQKNDSDPTPSVAVAGGGKKKKGGRA